MFVRRRALSIAAATAAAVLAAGLSATSASAAQLSPQTPTISQLATPGIESFNISAGPGGSIWYVADGPGALEQIGELPAGSDQPSYYDQNIIQPGQDGEAGLASITQGPDQNLWFTQSAQPSSDGSGVIYRISSGAGDSGDGPAGTIKYNRADGVLPQLGGITSSPDGRLWFTESTGAVGAPEEIGSIGVHGGVSAPISAGVSDAPGAITAGPDGSLYFTEPNNETIAALSPAGTVTPVITGIVGLRDVIYADGDLWFTAYDEIGEVSTAGTGLQLIPLTVDPDQIVAGPGSGEDLWFTTGTGAVGMVTPGATPTYSLLTQGITGLGTFGITATATQVWFTEGASGQLGIISP